MNLDLSHNAEFNRAGVKSDRLFFVPEEDVRGEDLQGLVVLKANKNWFTVDCTRYSCKWEGSNNNEASGSLLSGELSGRVPKVDGSKTQKLNYMSGRRFVALYRDKNNVLYQLGGFLQGLKFSYEETTGDGAEGSNSATIRFTAERLRKKKLPYNKELMISAPVSSPEPAPPETDPVAPAIVEINGFQVASLQPGETYSITSPFTLNYQLQGS